MRTLTMTTRSSTENLEFGTKMGGNSNQSESESDNTQANQNKEGCEEAFLGRSGEEVKAKDKADTGRTEEGSGKEVMEELSFVKSQLEKLQHHIQLLGGQANTPKNPISTEDLSMEQNMLANTEEFPALTQGPKQCIQTKQPSLLPSWRDKVSKTISPIGIPLKYVPPVVENGIQVVQIESHELTDLINVWERAIVVYVVGGNVTVETIRGFIRKHWSFVSMPTIHIHEDGYFIMRFNFETECKEVLKGGPYILNRAPIIVKQWTMNFDFKEEIIRVIPVWVRLPNLPLHCWGEDTLSRIVSAIGVPVIADECTSKQAKFSYARVLVEVDVTQDFVKEIKVRDNTGHEFVQKAIPEWRPFFCRKCNQLGHDCKDKMDRTQAQKKCVDNVEEKLLKEKTMWIPVTLAKLIQGVNTIEELKNKVNTGERNEDGTTAGTTSSCTV